MNKRLALVIHWMTFIIFLSWWLLVIINFADFLNEMDAFFISIPFSFVPVLGGAFVRWILTGEKCFWPWR